MSQENVELVRAAFDACNAGDMDALRELIDYQAVMRSPADWPEPGPFVGRDAVMREWEQLRETFDTDWQELISDILDSGDRAVVRTVWHGIGHGPEMKQESTVVFAVRNRRIFQIEFFADHTQALKVVGLEEYATSQENVERYYRVLDAWNRGDLDLLVGVMSAQVEISKVLVGVEEGYRGHDGVRRWWHDFHDVFPDWQRRRRRSVRSARQRLRICASPASAAASGAPVDQTMWHVVRWRSGRAVRITRHDGEPQALVAAKLRE